MKPYLQGIVFETKAEALSPFDANTANDVIASVPAFTALISSNAVKDAHAGDILINSRAVLSVTFRNLITHEVGHAIGLDHIPTLVQDPAYGTTSIMNRLAPFPALQPVDVAYVQAIYGSRDAVVVNGNDDSNELAARSHIEEFHLFQGADSVIGSPLGLNDDIVYDFGLDDVLIFTGVLVRYQQRQNHLWVSDFGR